MFLPVRASASVLPAVSVRPTASSSSRYGSNPASEVIAEPRNCSSRRRSKSSLSARLFASPVGSPITAPVNPPQDTEFYIRIVSNALKIATSSGECGLKRSQAGRGQIPMDIGNFSKHVLLTGAGWSRNWGARLADGVWQLLMDDPDVAANDRLRTMLLDEPSFELALAKTQVAPFTLDDREQLSRALVNGFVSMDRAMMRPFDGSLGSINIYKVQELLFR